MTKLEQEIEALKLENVALKIRIGNVESANNVLSKRILSAIAVITKSNHQNVLEVANPNLVTA